MFTLYAVTIVIAVFSAGGAVAIGLLLRPGR